jgi:predicted ATPase
MVPHVSEIQIRNYKSIGGAVVPLRPFQLLVGANGSGKSNFVDALAFVRDCLADSVEVAFRNRGGIQAVRRRSSGHPTHIGIRLKLDLAAAMSADYAFEIAARPTERFVVARERCVVERPVGGRHAFEVANGAFVREIPGIRPQVAPDRLALFAASATEEFRPVFDFLTAMSLYSIDPQRLRDLQEPDPGDALARDGRNAAAVLRRLLDEEPEAHGYEQLRQLLAAAVPGIESVEYKALGQRETIEFKQHVGAAYPWTFSALSMSDGTLRVLGLLLAVFQQTPPTVLAIEEPEATVHPAITELIVQVLSAASSDRQVLATTHSPDILDYKDVDEASILVVSKERNETVIAPLSASSRSVIREHLYTPGELLRMSELLPNLAEAQQLSMGLNLFGPLT